MNDNASNCGIKPGPRKKTCCMHCIINPMAFHLWVLLIFLVMSCICSTQSRNLRNLEIALRILRIPKLRDSAISVACTIEPFKFPSYSKVRDVRNKLLQLRRHFQCRECTLEPPHQGLLGSSSTRRNSLSAPGASGKFTNSEKLPFPRSGYGRREIPDLWDCVLADLLHCRYGC